MAVRLKTIYIQNPCSYEPNNSSNSKDLRRKTIPGTSKGENGSDTGEYC